MLKYTPVFETYEQSWLIKRLGNEHQRVIFSMIGSMNWICGLAYLIKNLPVDKNKFYSEVLKLEIDEESTNKIFCNILMSLDYLNSLKKIGAIENVYALMRISTISWYYGIYNAAQAMITATDRSAPETHMKTANEWYQKLATKGLVSFPFDYKLDSLVEKNYKSEIANYEDYNCYENKKPRDIHGKLSLN